MVVGEGCGGDEGEYKRCGFWDGVSRGVWEGLTVER